MNLRTTSVKVADETLTNSLKSFWESRSLRVSLMNLMWSRRSLESTGLDCFINEWILRFCWVLLLFWRDSFWGRSNYWWCCLFRRWEGEVVWNWSVEITWGSCWGSGRDIVWFLRNFWFFWDRWLIWTSSVRPLLPPGSRRYFWWSSASYYWECRLCENISNWFIYCFAV